MKSAFSRASLPKVLRTVAPTATDISYAVPSLWLDTTANKVYILTDVTGGVLTLTYEHCDAAADLGTNVSATAITAANEVHIGDVVQVEMAASGTGFTAAKLGAFKLLAVIQKLPGA